MGIRAIVMPSGREPHGNELDHKRLVASPHKEGFYAATSRGRLLPQRFILPASGHPHCGWVNGGEFREQCLDVFGEGVSRVDGVEPVGNVAEVWIKFVGGELSICNPSIGKSAWKAGINDDNSIPKAGMVGTDVANDGDTAQPTAHIFKFWDAKTTADGLFGSTVVHIAVELGKRSHRCDLHRFPYWRHRWCIVFLEMLLDKLVFRTVQLFLQISKITSKQIVVFCQTRVHKPESTMPFCKDANHSGSDYNLYMLNSRKDENAQLLVETIKTHYLGESGTGLEDVLPSVSLHQSANSPPSGSS